MFKRTGALHRLQISTGGVRGVQRHWLRSVVGGVGADQGDRLTLDRRRAELEVHEATPEGFRSWRPVAADLDVTAGGNLGKEFRACQQH